MATNIVILDESDEGLEAYMYAIDGGRDFVKFSDEAISSAIHDYAKPNYTMVALDLKSYDKQHRLLPYGLNISNALSSLAVEEGRRKRNTELADEMCLFSNHTRRYIFSTPGGVVIVKQAIGGFNLYKCRKNKTCGKHVGVLGWKGLNDLETWLRNPTVIYQETL